MLPYWLLWSYFCVGALLAGRHEGGDDLVVERRGNMPLFVAGLLAMTMMIGLRFEVGADWSNYERIYEWSGIASLDHILFRGDPAYYLLNWTAQRWNLEIWFVNLACAAATVYGIAALARVQPSPWLSVLLAIPYLVVVVAMGYTRQAAALGLVMAGLAGFIRHGSLVRYLLWVVAAALFHKTAVITLPLIAFTARRSAAADLLLVASATVGLYFVFLEDEIGALASNYLATGYSSSGAVIRVFMCLVPGIVFLLFKDRMGFTDVERRVWRNFSLVAVVAGVALALTPSSTAVDRVALYLLPMQFMILSRVPGAIVSRGLGTMLVAGYTAVVLFTWLTFAVHAEHWLPYRGWLT